jgi:hypothetical protein
VWARVGAEMKLVRVGSDLHRALLVSTADRTLKKLGYSDLQVGHIYKGKGVEQFIFLGYVDYSECVFTQERNRHYCYKSPPVLSRIEARNGLLLWSYSEHQVDKDIDFDNYYQAHTKTTHSFVKDCGVVDIPKDAVDRIREVTYKAFIKSVADYFKYQSTEKEKEENKLSTFAYHSPRLTVRKAGEPECKFPGGHMIDMFPLTDTIAKKIK